MNWELTTGTLGTSERIAIPESRFMEARAAWQGLGAALGIEEKFAFVIENFCELETAMMVHALEFLVYRDHDWSVSIAKLQHLNRLFSNLLSTCRLYLDQVPHALSTLYGNPSQRLATFDEARNIQYDALRGYRVMEALRNHTQHRSLPIYLLRLEAERNLDSGSRKYGVSPMLVLDRIRSDGGFKPTVLIELESQKEIDLKPLVREYIDGLSQVNITVRELLRADVARWDATTGGLFEEFEKSYGRREGPLSVWAVQAGDTVKESVPVIRELSNRRLALVGRLSQLHLTNAYVSSEVWNRNA